MEWEGGHSLLGGASALAVLGRQVPTGLGLGLLAEGRRIGTQLSYSSGRVVGRLSRSSELTAASRPCAGTTVGSDSV